MINFYVRRILSGKMTLEEVPNKWHDEVEEILQQLIPVDSDYATVGRILMGVEE